jgi:hypothetical protein
MPELITKAAVAPLMISAYKSDTLKSSQAQPLPKH